jgi:hypothetical protein
MVANKFSNPLDCQQKYMLENKNTKTFKNKGFIEIEKVNT